MKNNDNECIIYGVTGAFYWTTEYFHYDNQFTMNDFLENHLPDNAEIYLEDGSYVEISIGDINYALNAKGNGDSFNHIIEWNQI